MLRYTTIAILALSLAGSGVSAAPGPGGPPVSMDAADQTVQQLAANLSKQASVPIVVEANVDTKFGGGFNQAPLEQVLNALAKTSQVKWFKVYLPEDTTPEDMLREARQQVALLQSIRVFDVEIRVDFVEMGKAIVKGTRRGVDMAKARLDSPKIPRGFPVVRMRLEIGVEGDLCGLELPEFVKADPMPQGCLTVIAVQLECPGIILFG